MKKVIISIAIFSMLSLPISAQTYNDATLARVRTQDKVSRDAGGKLPQLAVSEHIYRADVYSSNRSFPEAREHWQKVIDHYSSDLVNAPRALFGIGRSYMWERQYALAIIFFDDLIKNHISTKDGREGLAFKGACLVRLGKNLEAAKTYEQYTIMFPFGEKIDSAYLNLIDALREAGKYDEANAWVIKARQRFGGMATETNALFGRLRMEIFQGNWMKAAATSDELRILRAFSGSMTSSDEALFLKALAFEKAGRRDEARAAYASIQDSPLSYYGGLATEKLRALDASASAVRAQRISSIVPRIAKDFPAPYRAELLLHAKSRGVDPRFVLAIMKQESSFRANAKSPAAARGLLQLTYDTALKYKAKAGYPNLQAEDLYNPSINIAFGSVYLAELKKEFGGLYEAIAASYNGGEDNAMRWLNRSKPKEAAVFASEVGFAESKNYVFKVMGNYRVYRELYTEDLRRR